MARAPNTPASAYNAAEIGDAVDRVRCRVPRCGGTIHYDTDGNGRIVGWCERCAERLEKLEACMAAKLKVREVPVPAPLEAATDEAIVVEFRRRYGTFAEIAAEYHLGEANFNIAVHDGRIEALRLSQRVILLSRASVAKWRAGVTPGRGRQKKSKPAALASSTTGVETPIVSGNIPLPETSEVSRQELIGQRLGD